MESYLCFWSQEKLLVPCGCSLPGCPVGCNSVHVKCICLKKLSSNYPMTFRIHLEVLYGQSPYFRRIIRANKKTKLGCLESILVPGISKDAFAAMVEFLYCAQLTLTSDKVDELLKAAEVLEMPDAVGLCKRYLIDRLNDENCIDIYTKYSRHDDLKEAARNYILAKFQQVNFLKWSLMR